MSGRTGGMHKSHTLLVATEPNQITLRPLLYQIAIQKLGNKSINQSMRIVSNIQGVTKRYGTNFRAHSSHLEDEIMLYEHGSGNASFPLK